MRIFWSKGALTSYQKTIDFILEKWPIEVAEKLEEKVNELFENIKLNNHLCPPSKKDLKIRRCIISKQTSILYEVRGNSIEILLFIDNRGLHNY